MYRNRFLERRARNFFPGIKRGSCQGSLKENAQSHKPFDPHTLRSRLSSYDLKPLREHYEIPPSVRLRLPDEGESANMTTIDDIGVYWDMFINGFRVPLCPFFIKVLNAYGLAPGQFLPHAWRFISFFIYQCYRLGLRPRRGEVCNVWLPECETKTCNALKEKDLSETDLERIEKLKGTPPLEAKYPLSNDQLRECGIIFSLDPQDYDEEEEEGENDPKVMSSRGDPPLFNAQGVFGDIIPDELVSFHGIEEEEILHRPAWGLSIDESVFKSPRTAWDWFSHAIIPMDRKTLSSYGLNETVNEMVQLMAQAMAQLQIGAKKLIAADKVLDEEKKKVMIENNFCREAKKKVEDLSKKVERLELSNVELTARVNDSKAEKSKVVVQAM
ncbi:hypothetical protein RJ639_013787 [Escallonia herrerae]|uniref:Transposase (putative) gypsy type domain-containing protein n=1 Tax=Escallonia herrerae TaxID=1293975 RepID=A0AA89ANX7_9ASTE|nr:hypothetical protein RJ639_013787 [Escallonia herrerae]